jgi:hypothetical protein
MNPRYPVFVPSKGRFTLDRALTAKSLARDGVPFRLVVEEHQVDDYWKLLDQLGLDPEPYIETLPFRDAGTSTPARNYIRELAEQEGAARHWQLDDNIIEFRRLYRGRRIPCHAGVALRVCEDFSDRFENVAVSGLNYQMFVPAETPVPFYVNVHVYSCTLVNHAWPGRWRLNYNEDTDLCLQALADGWCTVALNAFMANKMRTMTMGGGNTESLYRTEGGSGATDTDGRFEMARVLERAWPGLVTARRKFGRYQHSVNWRKFTQTLKLRDDVDLAAFPPVQEYGMTLREVKAIKAPAIRELLETYERERACSAVDPCEQPGCRFCAEYFQPIEARADVEAVERMARELGE